MKWLPYIILPLLCGAWAWGMFFGLEMVLTGAKFLGGIVWAFLGLVLVGFSMAGGAR